MFENSSIGKKTSVISEEPGSKLIFISGHAKPKIKLELLKGKTKILETSEIDLADAIEVKGMKAMGNRLSPHEVKSIEILQSPVEVGEDEVIVDPNIINDSGSDVPGLHQATPISKLARDIEESDNETEVNEEPAVDEVIESPSKDLEKASKNFIPEVQLDSSKEPESVLDSQMDEKDSIPEIVPEVQIESSKEPEKPIKKVGFEITNLDDLDIDDKGQLGLF
jgi:topoisomerase-4 subunit A